jgi:hypothetical protein
MLGYFFVFIFSFSSADRSGPGYRGASFLSLEPWDGGTNLVGFSRTRGLELEVPVRFLDGLVDAWRTMRDWAGVVNRVRQIVPLWGSRNRGMTAVEDMLSGLEALHEAQSPKSPTPSRASELSFDTTATLAEIRLLFFSQMTGSRVRAKPANGGISCRPSNRSSRRDDYSRIAGLWLGTCAKSVCSKQLAGSQSFSSLVQDKFTQPPPTTSITSHSFDLFAKHTLSISRILLTRQYAFQGRYEVFPFPFLGRLADKYGHVTGEHRAIESFDFKFKLRERAHEPVEGERLL